MSHALLIDPVQVPPLIAQQVVELLRALADPDTPAADLPGLRDEAAMLADVIVLSDRSNRKASLS